MPGVSERWQRDRLGSALYDYGVKHPLLAAPYGRLLFGTDFRRLYEAIDSLASLPPGTRLLDAPCGGGVAIRGIGPEVDYTGADISPYMLGRARAAGHGTFVECDITALPFGDASFDVCVTFNGLHCLADPQAAVQELLRVLRPGGELRGSTLVRGAGFRQNAVLELYRRAGIFGNPPSAEELRAWLGARAAIDHSGAIVYFNATRE